MVVFTCYHCGDSIQKPKVEKHIKLECKKKYLDARLCCIDCLKDFDLHSYVQHTKCVSEEERYSAKGFVPKLSSNKGEKKQNSWTEVIQTVLKKSSLNEPQRNLLKVLSNYTNVPRKQKKFKNFISSSLKHLRASNVTMDEVFKLIEDEFRMSNSANSDNNQALKKDSVDAQLPGESEKVGKSENVQSDDISAKKNKKNKSELKGTENIDIPEEATAEKENLDESAAFEIVKKKKKKSKKENVKKETVAMEVDKPDDMVQSNGEIFNPALGSNVDKDVSLKKISKKLKKSKLKEVYENPPTDDSRTIAQNSATEIVSNDVSATEANLNEEIYMKGISKKKLKKMKLLQEVHENPPSDDSQTNITQNDSTTVNSNEISITLPSPEKTKATDQVEPVEENLSKKERKEKKKKLKYEAELKAIETKTVEADELEENLENKTDENRKPKKKKRKLSENAENEKPVSKKTKVTESVSAAAAAEAENVESTAGKFKWEKVIRTVLEKADGNEISLKKLTKKVVAEYQACHKEETPYDDVLKKFNKKVTKCPFVKILKDKVKLSL